MKSKEKTTASDFWEHMFIEKMYYPAAPKRVVYLSQHIPWDASASSSSSPPSVVSFVASIDGASHFINVVIDKLPMAMAVLVVDVLIEFFILRPNINTYKEEN